MIGAYEASLRARAIEARHRLFNSPAIEKAAPGRRVIVSPFSAARIEAESHKAIQATKARYEPAKPIVNSASVIAEVAIKHGLSVEDITGGSRAVNCVKARREAAYRLVVELGLSNNQAGKKLNRDHTTILWAIRQYLRARPEARPAAEKRAFDRASLNEEVISLYFDEEYAVTQIMHELDLDRNTVNSIVRAEVRRVRGERLEAIGK